MKQVNYLFISLFFIFYQQLCLGVNDFKFTEKIEYSIKLYDLNKKETVFEKDTLKRFIPASLTKLIVSAAVLDSINKKYRFKTPIYIDKEIPPNLYIIGSGDPNISRKKLNQVALTLKRKNITKINNIIFDETHIVEDINLNGNSAKYYYALGGALNTNYNQYTLLIKKNNKQLIASPNSMFINIELKNVKFENKTRQPSYPKIQIQQRPFQDQVVINGTLSKGDELNKNLTLRVSRPKYYFYFEIYDVFTQNNIQVPDSFLNINTKNLKKMKVHTIVSEPIDSILIKLNQESENMIGSILFKHLGKAIYNNPGTIKKGRKAINDFIYTKISKSSDIKILDGSGLSKYSYVNSETFNKILIYLHKKHFKLTKKCLINIEGSNEYNAIKKPKHVNIYVKSGTLAQIGVNNLAGYIEDKKTKKLFSFTILTQTKEKKYNPAYKGTHTIPILNEIIKKHTNTEIN